MCGVKHELVWNRVRDIASNRLSFSAWCDIAFTTTNNEHVCRLSMKWNFTLFFAIFHKR